MILRLHNSEVREYVLRMGLPHLNGLRIAELTLTAEDMHWMMKFPHGRDFYNSLVHRFTVYKGD